jgi:hypothetical protein
VTVADFLKLVDLFCRGTGGDGGLAHSAVFRVREKTILRPTVAIAENGWSVAVVMAREMASQAVRPMTWAYALQTKSSCAGSSG